VCTVRPQTEGEMCALSARNCLIGFIRTHSSMVYITACFLTSPLSLYSIIILTGWAWPKKYSFFRMSCLARLYRFWFWYLLPWIRTCSIPASLLFLSSQSLLKQTVTYLSSNVICFNSVFVSPFFSQCIPIINERLNFSQLIRLSKGMIWFKSYVMYHYAPCSY